jgi:hypothetical protein
MIGDPSVAHHSVQVQYNQAPNYYSLLGLHPAASEREIRQAYRELSKLYHPDRQRLPTAVATNQFQRLNEAYATLSNPEQRQVYDRQIGYSSVPVITPLPKLHHPQPDYRSQRSASAYLDPTDRPLSSGEIFVLFMMGLTFIGCIILATLVGLSPTPVMVQANSVEYFSQPPPPASAGRSPSAPADLPS